MSDTTNDIGVTLRDWFAGQVIRGLLAGDGTDTAKQLATAGYEIADAMLAEREGGGQMNAEQWREADAENAALKAKLKEAARLLRIVDENGTQYYWSLDTNEAHQWQKDVGAFLGKQEGETQ